MYMYSASVYNIIPVCPRTMADRDGDGYINVSEFCSAMSVIRQTKLQLQQTSSLQWPSRGGGGGGGVRVGGV